MVVMGAGNMHPEIFERVLHGVEGISGKWQVAVRQEGLKDVLDFRLELSNGNDPATVENQVRHNLELRYPDIWSNHLCGMYLLKFQFVEPGTFQGRKIKRLIDERSA
jgi:phenylacetate-coenzyme A ligase PaaK-like adenylate-forming protein